MSRALVGVYFARVVYGCAITSASPLESSICLERVENSTLVSSVYSVPRVPVRRVAALPRPRPPETTLNTLTVTQLSNPRPPLTDTPRRASWRNHHRKKRVCLPRDSPRSTLSLYTLKVLIRGIPIACTAAADSHTPPEQGDPLKRIGLLRGNSLNRARNLQPRGLQLILIKVLL